MAEEKRQNVFITFSTAGIVLDPRINREQHVKLNCALTLEEFETQIEDVCAELKTKGLKPTGEMDIHYSILNEKEVYGEVLIMCII